MFFSLRLASPRPLSHGAREVTPTPISTAPSLPQASNRTTASGRPVQREHARDPLHEAELDHRGDVPDGFHPLGQTAPVIVIRPQREADALELVHVAQPASLHSRCNDFNAARQFLSNVSHWNNATLSDLQPSYMTSSKSRQITCSGAVAAGMYSTLLSILSSSSELAIASVEIQCCLRRRQRETKNNRARKVSVPCRENLLFRR